MRDMRKKLPPKNQWSIIGGQFMHGLGWLMVIGFTGTCTILLLQKYAPPQAPWLPFLGLAVCEYGVIHWLHYVKHNAENAIQALTSGIMCVLSILAIACCTGLEMVDLFEAQGGLSVFPDWVKQTAFIALIGITVINVFAFAAISLAEPRHVARLKQLATMAQDVSIHEQPQTVYGYAATSDALALQAPQSPEQIETNDKVLTLKDGRKIALSVLLDAFDDAHERATDSLPVLPAIPETPKPAKSKAPKNA